MEKKYFEYEMTAYLKDINLYGTAYFSRFFEWQGIAREAYFSTLPNFNELLHSGIIMITRKAWMDYAGHVLPFDNLKIIIKNRNLKRCSYELIFVFINKTTGESVGEGGQLIAFSDSSGKVLRVPDLIVNELNKYNIEYTK